MAMLSPEVQKNELGIFIKMLTVFKGEHEVLNGKQRNNRHEKLMQPLCQQIKDVIAFIVFLSS